MKYLVIHLKIKLLIVINYDYLKYISKLKQKINKQKETK